MRLFLVSLFLALPTAGSAREITVTIDAGGHDRNNTPVCVPLSLPKDVADSRAVLLTAPAGASLPGQLTAPSLLTEATPAEVGKVRRDLHFILPALKAGRTATFMVQFGGLAGTGFVWREPSPGTADLVYRDRPVLRSMHAPFDDSTKEKRVLTYKVFHHLFDPSGKELLTKWGPDAKFPHHRGLFYGFKATYGDGKPTTADIWHCPPPGNRMEAHQAFEKTLAQEAGPVLGRHRLQIGWHGTGKERFAVEERELTAYAVEGGLLIEFASKLTPVKGTVKLDGDPQHAGFHFRASREVDEKTSKQTYYLRPDGKDAPGKTRNWPQDKKHVNLPWNAMSFVVGGTRFTAAYLDRPANPKEARFSERDYGRFGSYFVAECSPTKPLLVDYRLWVQEGEMTVPAIAARSTDFVTPPAARARE